MCQSRLWRIVRLGMVGAAIACRADAADLPDRSTLGRETKLRILVDKVMQPTAGWVTREWMVKECARAGFNVFSPRRGHDRLEEVIQVTDWCAQSGLYHMPWMRGTLAAPMDESAAGRRVVWSNGVEQPLWSVNSDEFWEWTSRFIIEYARISRDHPALLGVFLDYENYAKGKVANLYDLSYDEGILKRFAAARDLDLPVISPAERKAWLVEKGLHEAFETFQVAAWRERCRTLRQAVDAWNPNFRFCIYPAPGTPFMVKACYPEWATEEAPLILADPWGYGRPSSLTPHAAALAANRAKLLRMMEVPSAAGIPFVYVGGVDPVVRGADPEFSGKNALMMAAAGGGYWVFYEGPKYTTTHPEYFRWFTWANRAVAQGRPGAWREPRVTPDDWALSLFRPETGTGTLVAPDHPGRPLSLPEEVRMRGGNVLLIAGQRGKPVALVLKNRPVARYECTLTWRLRSLDQSELDSGTIPHNGTGTVAFTPKEDGLFLLGITAEACAYSVLSTNAPFGILAADGASFIYGAERLYFHVPAGLLRFTIRFRGSGAETVRVDVYRTDGTLAASGQTSLEEANDMVTVVTGNQTGGVWSLSISQAETGVLDDNRIYLDRKLPPTLSLSSELVFRDAGQGLRDRR